MKYYKLTNNFDVDGCNIFKHNGEEQGWYRYVKNKHYWHPIGGHPKYYVLDDLKNFKYGLGHINKPDGPLFIELTEKEVFIEIL